MIIRYGMKLIGVSSRIRKIEGKEYIDKILKTGRPVIFCFWHNNILYCTYYLHEFVHKKGCYLTVLISRSKDGELIARVVEDLGGTAARGSSTRYGSRAFRELYENMKREFNAIAITPDGPKGPQYVFQPGSVILSQITQCPIIPVYFDADRKWILNSWDHFKIPKPFANICLHIGKPYQVPRELDPEKEKKVIKKLEKMMLDQVKKYEF